MKKFLFISVLVFITAAALAQPKLRLNAYSSYVFDDGFQEYYENSTYFNGKITGGVQWGGGIEYVVHPNSSVELLYLGRSTTAPVDFKAQAVDPTKQEDFDLDLHYIMLAGNGLKSTGTGKVEGYASLMGGVLISDVKVPSTGETGSNTTFAWGARLGTNVWLTSRIGIKLQAQLLSSSKATGGDLYFSYYGPIVLETYTTLWQFGLGGGLTFKLGK